MQYSIITVFALASIAAAAPAPRPVFNSTRNLNATSTQAVAIPLKSGLLPATTFTAPKVAVADDPAADSGADTSDYIKAALSGHNIHRANHSAPALTYNTQLAGYAAEVAASCNFAHDLSEGGGGYGQNIAAYASSDFTGFTQELLLEVAISDQWYNGEAPSFTYYGEATPDMSDFESWGHFSQMVWASTTGVGCATQLCAADTIFDGMESYFTVCNYEGAGNIDGIYNINVLEPLGQPTYAP